MELWRYTDAHRKGWQHPLEQTPITVSPADPLQLQLEHFRRAVRGEEEPPERAGIAVLSVA
jgi:hypothetical protein